MLKLPVNIIGGGEYLVVGGYKVFDLLFRLM